MKSNECAQPPAYLASAGTNTARTVVASRSCSTSRIGAGACTLAPGPTRGAAVGLAAAGAAVAAAGVPAAESDAVAAAGVSFCSTAEAASADRMHMPLSS